MLTEFIQQKMNRARYKKLDDGTYFGEIPSFKGVWANSSNLEKCREELREIFEEWVLLKIKSGENIRGLSVPSSTSKKVKSFSNA